MTLQLTSHFVAFIDILGFSEMVRHDCEAVDGPKYLELLHNAHLRATQIFGKNLDAGLIQFSDSIVFSRSFDLKELASFLAAIASWQQSLIQDGLLCRGGVTFGKHFVKDRFMFSKGLIDAYYLESTQARYPRIVVSENLLELASPVVNIGDLNLLREEDGLAFIDYLSVNNAEDEKALASSIEKLILKSARANAAVQEKMRWLARYSDFRLGSKLAGASFKSA